MPRRPIPGGVLASGHIERTPKYVFQQMGLHALESTLFIEECGTLLMSHMVERIAIRGISHTGARFSAYKDEPGHKERNRGKPARLFWVPPEFEQPGGHVRKGTSGAKAYLSRAEYERLRGHNPTIKRFIMTGGMWRGLRLKIYGPKKLSIAFFKSSQTAQGREGKVEKVKNRIKAAGVEKNEGTTLLAPSRSELRAIDKYVEQFMTKALLQDWDEKQQNFDKMAAAIKRRRGVESKVRKFRRLVYHSATMIVGDVTTDQRQKARGFMAIF